MKIQVHLRQQCCMYSHAHITMEEEHPANTLLTFRALSTAVCVAVWLVMISPSFLVHLFFRTLKSFLGGSCWTAGCPLEWHQTPLASLCHAGTTWRRHLFDKDHGNVAGWLYAGSCNEPSVSLAGSGELRSSLGTARWAEGFGELNLETGFLCSQPCPVSSWGNTGVREKCQHMIAESRADGQSGCPHSALRERPFASQDP